MREIELLSPAGGMEALRAAVQNGADAVYLGEKSFSARRNAENFDEESLTEGVMYAHQRGTKVYLALNTLIHENEQKSFEKSVLLANNCGVDALIIQDFGGAHIARSVCPDMPIHASTQMSAHNEKDVIYLLERGFSRVVLARELTREEISKIYKNTKASLEVFVHGALCVGVSGQCLMSSFIGGRSGNRGLCAQPCRQKYSAEGKNGYFLSPRDLCLLDEIGTLGDIGVDSLKIEGRMKSPEYVATVTGMYRKYLDNPKRATKEDVKELEKVFVRGDGFTKAYFAKINTPAMMNYDLSNDGISYRSDKDILKKAQLSYREGAENKKVFVDGYFTMKKDMPIELLLTDGVNSAVKYASVPEVALKVAVDKAVAEERISKMGQTPFVLNYFEANIDPGLTISAKEMNALRRDCAEELLQIRGKRERFEVNRFEYEYPSVKRDEHIITVSVMTKEQLEGANDADVIYMPMELYKQSQKLDKYVPVLNKVVYDFEKLVRELRENNVKTVMASTIGTLKALQKEGFNVIGDYGLNITNPVSANEYKKFGIEHITLSPELSCEEIRGITSSCDANCEVIAYGRQMMMTARACIIKGVRGRCDCDRVLKIKDKTGAEFLVYSDKDEHINMIYNSAVTFMADKADVLDRLNVDSIRLVFTDETKEKVEDVIAMYKGEREIKLPQSFTRGYFSGSKKK